jgi:integrase
VTKKKLTDFLIKHLEAPKQGQVTYFDAGLPGFGVRVSQGGAKSFVLVFGKQRKLRTLGRYEVDLTLAEARKKAMQVMGELLATPDTVRKAVQSMTFVEARDRFLGESQKRTKLSTFTEYQRLLEKHFTFSKPLHSLTRQDIMTAIGALSSKPSIEQHAFVAIRTMMNWCVRQGLLDASPVPALRFSTQSRSRILTDAELKAVWHRAMEEGHPYGTIIQLLVLTGQRRGEIAGLRRSWIAKNTISFPAGFCKNKREHVIPLGNLAKNIIDSIPGDGDLLFPARGKTNTPFAGWSKAKAQFDHGLGIAPYTLHDLRRTFSSQMAALGTPIHVTEKLLNHVSGTLSGVAGVYNRYSYAAEMRSGVEDYEDHLERLVTANQQ